MAKKKEDKPIIRIMSDDEFNAMKLKENKSSFLDDLIEASNKKNNGSRFSVKKIDKSKSNDSDDIDDDNTKISDIANELSLSAINSINYDGKIGSIDSDDWDEMLDRFEELSPIEDITLQDRMRYRRKSEGDRYDAMFDKERSMLNDVLSDLQSRSKIVNNSIKHMVSNKPSGGRGGVSKVFTELVEAGNSLDTSKLQVIKALVDIKKTSIDLRIKEQKNLPQEDEEDTNTIADQFFKKLTSVGTRQLQNNMSQQYDPNYMNQENDQPTQFSLSQPLEYVGYDGYDDIADYDVDSHGYIRNESRGVDVFVYRYDDDSIEFVALDEDGVEVHDYELPSQDLLYTMTIKPMSPYAYDEYGRKYKIIDRSSTVDIGDLDDPDIDNVTDDDKYDY